MINLLNYFFGINQIIILQGDFKMDVLCLTPSMCILYHWWLDISEDKVVIVVKEERTQNNRRGMCNSSYYNVVIFCTKGIKLYEIDEVSLLASY